jgi:hypothetical protein
MPRERGAWLLQEEKRLMERTLMLMDNAEFKPRNGLLAALPHEVLFSLRRNLKTRTLGAPPSAASPPPATLES